MSPQNISKILLPEPPRNPFKYVKIMKMDKKHAQEEENTDSIPMVNEEEESMGEIRINHSVVASIVRLATLSIDGVYSVDSSLVEGITELFSSRKDTDRGVRVSEDEVGDYIIEVRVVLRFGVELAKVAVAIQDQVREQVSRMTMKNVRRVDVVIDGVKTGDSKEKASTSNNQDD